jgi:integrase
VTLDPEQWPLSTPPGTACKEPRYHRRCTGRWRGALDLGRNDAGKRAYRKVSGSTRQEVIDKLDAAKIELAKGIRPKAGYTVAHAVQDWLNSGLPGRSAKTLSTYREVTDPLLDVIGGKLLTELTGEQVRAALVRIGKTRSTRSLQIAHRSLTRAITYVESRDRVGRNVARFVSTPTGKAPGRPSKSLTVLDARKLVYSARESRLHAYIVLCLTTGIRTEEARALHWSEVNLLEPSVAVYRSVRARGETKTPRSRRKLMIPELAAPALEDQQERQAKEKTEAGPRWKETGLVFTSGVGTALDAAHVRRAFKDACEAAGLGRDWTPRELRTSFVSVMSASGAPIEQIARLVGHTTTTTTEEVYRKQIAQAAMSGPELLDTILTPPRRMRVRRKPRSAAGESGNATPDT